MVTYILKHEQAHKSSNLITLDFACSRGVSRILDMPKQLTFIYSIRCSDNSSIFSKHSQHLSTATMV